MSVKLQFRDSCFGSSFFRSAIRHPQSDIRYSFSSFAIYLFKQHTGLTNKQMGSICGEMSYSAVSKAYHRFKENLEEDTVLKKEVEEVMSNVKG